MKPSQPCTGTLVSPLVSSLVSSLVLLFVLLPAMPVLAVNAALAGFGHYAPSPVTITGAGPASADSHGNDVTADVIVFVIDSNFSKSGHGGVSVDIIKELSPLIEVREARVDEGDTPKAVNYVSYLHALNNILAYINKHPVTRVVVNISLGSYAMNPYEGALIETMLRQGAAIVAAAGNDSTSRKFYPAAYKGVISVGSVTSATRKITDYSNYGDWVTVFAPSYKTFFAYNSEGYNTYGYYEGSSFAAPYVTGIIAEAFKRNPKLSSNEIGSILNDTSDGLGVRIINKDKILSRVTGSVPFISNLKDFPRRYLNFTDFSTIMASIIILLVITLMMLVIASYTKKLYWAARRMIIVHKLAKIRLRTSAGYIIGAISDKDKFIRLFAIKSIKNEIKGCRTIETNIELLDLLLENKNGKNISAKFKYVFQMNFDRILNSMNVDLEKLFCILAATDIRYGILRVVVINRILRAHFDIGTILRLLCMEAPDVRNITIKFMRESGLIMDPRRLVTLLNATWYHGNDGAV